MRILFLLALALSTSSAMFAQGAPKPAPQTVEIPSGNLRLKGLLWKPQGPGPFPAVVFNHGRSDTPQLHSRQLKLMIEDAAEVLAADLGGGGDIAAVLTKADGRGDNFLAFATEMA